MPSGSLPRTRLTSRAAPWLLATLTLALALAGPANADSFGAEELQEAEAMLAAEVPEVPMEAPPDVPEVVPEPVVEPAAEPPSEPVAAPEPQAPAPPPAEEVMTLGASDPAEPGEPAEPDPVEADLDLAEKLAGEAPASIDEEPTPAMPDEGEAEAVDDEDAEPVIPPVVVPVNLNVDLRILSPGNDGDVSQVIDLGGLGLDPGSPADVLGALDLGLDWKWNWNWEWDCGDASAAGLDWNWTWTWSGDCAAGIFDESRDGPGSLGEHIRGDGYAGLLDALSGDGLSVPAGIGDEPGPLVSIPGAGGSGPTRSHGRDEAESSPAPASPLSGAGPWVPSDALTSFASTGAPSQSKTATAPSRRPAGADPNGDPERQPAGLPIQPLALAAAPGGGGGAGAFSVLLLAALVAALALVPPPPGGRVTVVGQTLSSLLSSSRLERPG
jgi:hypothetical protein